MRFDTALKALDGQSCGGQLIVRHEDQNVLVGKHHDGLLLVEDNDLAKKIVASISGADDAPETPAQEGRRKRGPNKSTGAAATPEPAAVEDPPVHHDVQLSDEMIMADDPGGDD